MTAILKSKDIPLQELAQRTGYGPGELTSMLASGRLGPPPASTDRANVPLLHIAALFTLREGGRVGATNVQMAEVLPSVSAAAYIRLAIAEHQAGRCVVGRGTPAHQLWTDMKLGGGTSIIESLLPLNGVKPKRFAFFSDGKARLLDLLDLKEVEFEGSPTFIDSWGIARSMKRALPGTLFWTEGRA